MSQRENKLPEIDNRAPLAERYSQRLGLPLVDRLLPLLDKESQFVILDGGAREAHVDRRWEVIDRAHITIHGFEPDEAECRRLNDEAAALGLKHHYYPVGLWSEDTVLPFDINQASGGSSFLKQNVSLTNRWKFENPQATTPA